MQKRQPDFRLTAGRCAPVIDGKSVSVPRPLVKKNSRTRGESDKFARGSSCNLTLVFCPCACYHASVKKPKAAAVFCGPTNDGGSIMSYPKTGEEVYVSLNLSNTMLTGLGKGTITREDVSVDYLKKLFEKHGVIVSAKPEYRNIMERVNNTYDLGLDIPEKLRLFQLSEQHRRLVVVNISGLQRKNGSLLPSYTEEELDEATFTFVKYYVQGEHYDELVEENKKLRYELEQEISWRNRTDSEG
jgi:hypothetical protein